MIKVDLITKLLTHPVFQNQPPVLVDIGASGEVYPDWAAIAPYSICLAFDGDDRDLKSIKINNGGYKELILYHRILTSEKRNEADFILTRSPYCSSMLEPDLKSLESYSFRDLFQVDRKIQLKAVNLPEVLAENHLDYIDWFKTDSQGTDLRLFKSLPEAVLSKVKIADFEPGIIDAYIGEDKFGDLLQWMQGKPFFLDTLHLESVYRIKPEILNQYRRPDLILRYMKTTPGWVNARFMNTGNGIEGWTLRDSLFYLLCCIINRQFGMSYEFSGKLQKRFPEEKLFSEIQLFSEKQLKVNFLPDMRKRIRNRLHRLIDKLF